MSYELVVVHYIMYAMVLGLAVRALIIGAGCSLLAVYAVSLVVQVGTVFFVVDEAGVRLLLESTVEQFGYGLIFSYAVLCCGLLLTGRMRHAGNSFAQKQDLSEGALWPSSKLLITSVFACFLLIYLRATSSGAGLVFSRGFSVLGGDEYYFLRADLIDVGVKEVSRVLLYLEMVVRPALMLLLCIIAYRVKAQATLESVAFYCFLLFVLLFAEMTRFQKAPVLWVFAAAFLPFLLLQAYEDNRYIWKNFIRGFFVLAVLLLLSAALFQVSQGKSLADGMNSVVERIFYVPAYSTAMHFEVFPAFTKFVEWSDLRPVRFLLDNGHLVPKGGSISIEVAEQMTGFSYNANASMIAGFWAEFGYIGVCLGMTVATSFCLFVDRYVRRRISAAEAMPLIIFYWVGFSSYGNSPFLNVVLERGLWFLPFLYCYLLSRRYLRPHITQVRNLGAH